MGGLIKRESNMSETRCAKFDYAKTIADPLRRRLYVCALVTEALPQSDGLPCVVVGDNALEFYTLGAYATVDVELVGARRTEIGNLLESWGFERAGRHWHHAELDVLIEIPDDVLAGSEDKVIQVEIEDLTVYIIGVEDLIIDRLSAYIHWHSTDDGNWARELMVLYRQDIDWAYLKTRAQSEEVLKALIALGNQAGEDGQ